MPPVRSLRSTADQSSSASGSTHASRVIALVRFSDVELLIVTQLLTPLNESAWPNLLGAHVALVIVPVLPLPDVSVRVVPLPWLKLYSATNPVRLVTWKDTVADTPADGISMLPLSSAARLLTVTCPGESGAQL